MFSVSWVKGTGFTPPWRYCMAQRMTVTFQGVAVMWLFAPASSWVQRDVPGRFPGLLAKLHACNPIPPSKALELSLLGSMTLCFADLPACRGRKAVLQYLLVLEILLPSGPGWELFV